TSPANGAVFPAPGAFTLQAQAADSSGQIEQINFYQNGVLLASASNNPAALPLQNLAPGSYTYIAKAPDNLGLTIDSAPVSIQVQATVGVSVINFDSLNASSGAVGGT